MSLMKFEVGKRPEGLFGKAEGGRFHAIAQAFKNLKIDETIRIPLDPTMKSTEISKFRNQITSSLGHKKLRCATAVVGNILHVFKHQREV